MPNSLAIEIISRLDSIESASKGSLWSIIVTVVGMLLVSFGSWIFTYRMHAKDHEDKYRLLFAEKRIVIYQKIYYLCRDLVGLYTQILYKTKKENQNLLI